ncbi:hypothetical protein LCGC14_0890890 [marine sediment metagenome]|uniref:Uncharacterized protein n=1 Tax=marine sediment metagenome TaxID=412755 RepID=A0A0F9P469_9ZZZZ
MDRTTVTCTDTNQTMGADILNKSDRRLTVAVDGTEMSIALTKRDPYDKYYVGTAAGFEFTSTGY